MDKHQCEKQVMGDIKARAMKGPQDGEDSPACETQRNKQ